MADTKRCARCGQDKPRSEFYVAHKATATRAEKLSSNCKNCEADRQRDIYRRRGGTKPGKINRNRARHRAVADLIAAHPDEFAALYQQRQAEAEAEADDLAAHRDAQGHDHGGKPQPVRLRPGRRREGEKAGDRIDVARCPHCVRHHDRGHVCANCGATPPVRAECGTEKGYQMHRYRGELACRPCLKGHSEHEKRRTAVRDGDAEPRWRKGNNGVWIAS